jgi:hypothetical protein
MFNIIQFINSTIGSSEFLFVITVVSLLFKMWLFSAFFRYGVRLSVSRHLLVLMGLFLTGFIIDDIAWIVILIRKIFQLNWMAPLTGVVGRFAWVWYSIKYQALSLFVVNLVTKKFTLRKLDIPFLAISSTLCCYYFSIMITGYGVPCLSSELFIIQLTRFYLVPLFAVAIWKIVKNVKSNQVPTILTNQLRVLICYFVIPQICLELLNTTFSSPILPFNEYAFTSIIACSAMLILYYSVRHIMGLRFLNLKGHVESKESFNFVTDFKDILEQLSYVSSLKELSQLTQAFFQRAFVIPLGRTRLCLRQKDAVEQEKGSLYHDIVDMQTKVETFLATHEAPFDAVAGALHSSKIFIRDEIEFTNFYQESALGYEIISFLDTINADVFLPIYERKTISAYIIVERDARPGKLYTSKDRDEMLVFTNYLSNVINLLKYSNLEALQQREKELHEELYHKHQEINHYKESIRSFLRSHKERKIGIVFYKARRFSYANEAAQELIDADVNTEQGHPLALALKDIVRKVQEYKSSQTAFAYDAHGTKLVVTGIPSFEQSTVIIMLYYPEVADIIRAQFELLKDPSKWDYILYLETTQSGQLINQLIPGTGERLLNFKINLLESALSKKATLLDMPEDDLLPTIEIIHHISVRQQLHIVKLSTPERNHEVAMKLFGLNPLLGAHEEGLLQKLDNGTLFIENIHLLSLETQQSLADFITYGYFYKFRSDHKVAANVRIICSSNHDLAALASAGQFSKVLLNELKKASLSMPSLATLPDTEVAQLAEGFSHQAMKAETFKNIIHLSDKDRDKLLDQRPVSLHELKTKVHQVLVAKSTKHQLYDTTEFDPAYHVSDPELVQAVRMGKKALKDPHVMRILWNKFKNQNKIAVLLGVNRSSVNRRCQEYNLREDEIH